MNFSNTYFSEFNCKKIGYIRENIESNYINGELNTRERAVLITSLLYAMDKIANTVGHYDAYRKNGNLDRTLELCMLDLKSNTNNKNNKVFNEDSNELVKKIIAIRNDKHISQRELCAQIGMKQPALVRIENQNNSPSLKTVLKILEPLGYTLEIKKITNSDL